MTEKLEVDWVISLGKYEAANWTLGATEESGLYPHTTKVRTLAGAWPAALLLCVAGATCCDAPSAGRNCGRRCSGVWPGSQARVPACCPVFEHRGQAGRAHNAERLFSIFFQVFASLSPPRLGSAPNPNPTHLTPTGPPPPRRCPTPPTPLGRATTASLMRRTPAPDRSAPSCAAPSCASCAHLTKMRTSLVRRRLEGLGAGWGCKVGTQP